MRIIPPITADILAVNSSAFAITAAMLTSSTAVEPGIGESAWASGTTYAIGDKAIIGAPSATVTISIASPGVVTWNANGLPDGVPVTLATTGALPTGLAAGTIYYVVNRTTNTFQLAADPDGKPIVTSGTQSGVHTAAAQVHRAFESLVGSNTGNPPAIDDGTHWTDVGPTNMWAMFDLLRNTQTTLASPLTVVLTPGKRIDAIGLVGLVADSATISISSAVAGGVVYTHTESLIERPTTTWSDYFFGEFRQRVSLARFDLPPYVDAVITITLTRSSGYVSCGGVVIGRQVYIGGTQYAAESDWLNFSTITRDDFGNSELVRRRAVPAVNANVLCKKELLARILTLRDQLNAVPALWASVDDDASDFFEPLLILGIYKRWLIDIDQPLTAIQQIQLEEV